MSFCQIILVGNVGRDPTLRYTPSGAAVCDFSIAVNRSRKDASGEKHDETTWFKVTVWGQQAETVNQYVSKGKQVLVVADRIQASTYTGQDGQARASLEVTANTVRFLSGGAGGGAQGSYDERDSGYQQAPADVDDIPF